MDQVYVIRHRVFVGGRSIRKVAREMSVSRNTVRRYVQGAQPGVRAPTERGSPVKGAVQERALALLEDSPRWTGGKQRLTAARLHQMLLAEGFVVGETVVKEVVREWKRQRQEVFVPLVYGPGDLAQVDFFEVLVDVAGERRKAWMFVMRLMHSGRSSAIHGSAARSPRSAGRWRITIVRSGWRPALASRSLSSIIGGWPVMLSCPCSPQSTSGMMGSC